MVQHDEKPSAKVRKRKRDVRMDRSAEEKPIAEESFLICEDTVQSDTILLKTEPVIVVVINQ
jgi:hypothetical protein